MRLPKQGAKRALWPVACILFLIKRESWRRREEQPVTPLSLLRGPDLEVLPVFRAVWVSGWSIPQGMSWLDGSPDPGKEQASSAVETDSSPTAAFHQDQGFGFSTLLPTVSLINSELVTTASALSRQTGVGL